VLNFLTPDQISDFIIVCRDIIATTYLPLVLENDRHEAMSEQEKAIDIAKLIEQPVEHACVYCNSPIFHRHAGTCCHVFASRYTANFAANKLEITVSYGGAKMLCEKYLQIRTAYWEKNRSYCPYCHESLTFASRYDEHADNCPIGKAHKILLITDDSNATYSWNEIL